MVRPEQESINLFDAEPEPAGFRPGDLIGERYQLCECIGAGAMGAVFRAHDRLLDAEIAMKLVRVDSDHPDAERATQRLLLEARAIARISHPGIVRIFDFGCVGGVPFIAMELLSGESLLELMLREGPLDPIRAACLLLPVADAISVGHRRAVVHRDIKPENVFLATDELGRVQPKLVDFGVARVREGGSRLTRPGALMGTPDYMAPEQAQAEPDVDHRADVWAFAVLLYELMTMRRPFSEGKQGGYLSILKAIVSDDPPNLVERGVTDQALWSIIERALEKRRERRWQSMRELGDALAEWLLDKGVEEDAYGSALRTRWAKQSISVGSMKAAEPIELESLTMRKLSPPEPSDPLTMPPDATAEPPLRKSDPLRNELTLESERRLLKRDVERPLEVAARIGRGNTLESTRLRNVSPIMLALLAAVIAALTTALLLVGASRFLHKPAPPSVGTR
ncbi:MAG TPA: serine/threonine-protein kinase [Polyangiaceae bacterium]|nr:serine/threonine-protein kinase [Polyangiaceae bacterium]